MHTYIHLKIELYCSITIYSPELVCRRLFDEGLCIKPDHTCLRYVIISKKNGILQHHVHFLVLQKVEEVCTMQCQGHNVLTSLLDSDQSATFYYIMHSYILTQLVIVDVEMNKSTASMRPITNDRRSLLSKDTSWECGFVCDLWDVSNFQASSGCAIKRYTCIIVVASITRGSRFGC